MKEVHLVCNAHIDPIWQWGWEEGGPATAISTFKSAVNLLEEFDYVFCHNEAYLYKFIEEYEPELFQRIKELVKCGKWRIIGGWFIQPDCTMPSGESFVRQILMGMKYFEDKFDEKPTTAVCFDSFGHTRGLVQIIKKCGQDSYVCCRPSTTELQLESEQFVWKGFDGSKIKVNRAEMYPSELGEAVETIKMRMDLQPQDVIFVPWGVGNHGGGPSRKDLIEIKQMREGGVNLIHSTPESFFAKINPQVEVNKSLYISMPGCYSSMSRIKRKHIKLENDLFFAEKICSVAAMKGLVKYPENDINLAFEDLLLSQFHDVLAGTVTRFGEEQSLNALSHGLRILEKVKARAYFALCTTQKIAGEGEYPIIIFNPQPYEYKTNIECEITLAELDFSKTASFVVYDESGNELVSQIIKEDGNIAVERRKRVIFECVLKPLELNRFNAKLVFLPIENKTQPEAFIYDDGIKHVEINKQTGLLSVYKYNGVDFIEKDAFQPVFYTDNEDPWGMSKEQLTRLGGDRSTFELMNVPNGIFHNMKSVQMIEDGDIYLGVESFFEKDNTRVRLNYKIYKNNPYVDVDVDVYFNEANKILRLEIPIALKGDLVGQTAYGIDHLYEDGRENTSQRFIAVKSENECFAVINNCSYSSKFENDVLSLSLIRGATYCAHPVEGLPDLKYNQFTPKVDQGEHNFNFRITACKTSELERLAQEFNQKPYGFNNFPIGDGKVDNDLNLHIDNKDIVLETLKKGETVKGYVFRLANNHDKVSTAKLSLCGKSINLNFGAFEVKTIIYNDDLFEIDGFVI